MEKVAEQPRETVSGKIAGLLERWSGWLLLIAGILTFLFAIPIFTMAPDETASDSPGGAVYDLQNLIDHTLPPRVHLPAFLVEATNRDILTQAPLWELFQNTVKLREADLRGELHPPDLPKQPYLYNGFDANRQVPVVGVFTLADAVQEALRLDPRLATDLEHATDEQVKLALHLVFGDLRTDALKDTLSEKKNVERRSVLGQEIDYWTSPAFFLNVFADNNKLGGGILRIGAVNPVTEGKEHFNRKVQEKLRGEQENYQLWGVAIDAGLEIADEVSTAVPFIVATFIMVLVVVGISLRSGRVVFLTGLGLISMIIWLKGLSNLVGLNSSTTLDFIVPIAMISLGADFAIHAVHRYREERMIGLDARSAFRTGIGAVLVALVLAMLTDSIAFLSNTSAEIETVVGFGIGAALAVLATFVILGVAVPLALMRLDSRRDNRKGAAGPGKDLPSETLHGSVSPSSRVAGIMVALAQRSPVVLLVAVLITAVAAFSAFQLEASFDVKDFFKSNSDFVVSLDKIDEHVSRSGGEPATVYIRGDLADPASLDAIQGFMDSVADNPYVATNDYGEATLQARPLFVVLDRVVRSGYARDQIEQASGVSISTEEGLSETSYAEKVYRWPNSREQLEAIYDYISVNGVPQSPSQNIYDHLEIGETFFHDPTGVQEDATIVVLGIPGTREQKNIVKSRDAFAEDIRALEAAAPISFVGLTGSPYTRQAGLDATTDSLQKAFLISIFACLLVAIVAMRSLRFGIVTIIPIGLVVAWLYGFMHVFGFGLNFITATIAAVSIGVGIDYSIHMTQRFRQELALVGERTIALRRAGEGTGLALVASAATSILGFAIMGFAPMPMFASYGILTAIIIFLALVAALLVLPSLLFLVTPAQPHGAAPHEVSDGS